MELEFINSSHSYHDWIVLYYFVMWLVNASAYFVAGWAVYRWHLKLQNIAFPIGLARFAFMMAGFGLIRFGSGLVAGVRYWDGAASPLATIETFGVVSLGLNTIFITTFAIAAYIDAKHLWQAEPTVIDAVRTAMRMLRTTIDDSKSPQSTAERVLDARY